MSWSRVAVDRRIGLILFGAGLMLLLAASPVVAASGWTGPTRIGATDACGPVVAAIDASGGYHVAAECNGRIRYSWSGGGGAWSTLYFAHAADQVDLVPQIAIDGQTVYVAFTENEPGGCGPMPQIGVFYRKRSLPDGHWSAAIRIGLAGDHLQSFRVVGGVFHATVDNSNNFHIYYEIANGSALHRYVISDAQGNSSLRIGSDGKARIVYQGQTHLRYAVFTGSGFATSTIPGTNGDDQFPALVLDAGNHAHVTWTREPGPGCATRDLLPTDGTYYATNKSGTWSPTVGRQVTHTLGLTSLTVDVATGRVHLLVTGSSGVHYYTKTASGSWSAQNLTTAAANSGVIRQNPANGRLLVVYSRLLPSFDNGSLYEFTKP